MLALGVLRLPRVAVVLRPRRRRSLLGCDDVPEPSSWRLLPAIQLLGLLESNISFATKDTVRKLTPDLSCLLCKFRNSFFG